MKRNITHTLNPATGQEILINGDRFNVLLRQGYKYDEELNRSYDKQLFSDTEKYNPRKCIGSLSNRPMLVGGMVHRELENDGYRCKDGK